QVIDEGRGQGCDQRSPQCCRPGAGGGRGQPNAQRQGHKAIEEGGDYESSYERWPELGLTIRMEGQWYEVEGECQQGRADGLKIGEEACGQPGAYKDVGHGDVRRPRCLVLV